MSGLQIFNAHPALYWGNAGANPNQALFEIGAHGAKPNPAGFTRVGATTFDTTGIFGVSRNAAGREMVRGFPRWAALPGWRDLALGRRWHFFFAWLFVANLLLYLLAAIASGHLQRDLLPARNQLRPRALLRDIADHLRLKLPHGDAAQHYNLLQKLSYLAVVFVLLPAMVLTGLTMSPGMDAVLPWLIDIFGGRQSARTIHFYRPLRIGACRHGDYRRANKRAALDGYRKIRNFSGRPSWIGFIFQGAIFWLSARPVLAAYFLAAATGFPRRRISKNFFPRASG
jgi:thiosulfate reductase cytochrome b subunit